MKRQDDNQMLHIILLILKILGFLILGILALLLLVLLFVLISPAVYRLEVSGEDTLESVRGEIRFHWLFHLISGQVIYGDSGFDWRLRAVWKHFDSESEAWEEDAGEQESVQTEVALNSGKREEKPVQPTPPRREENDRPEETHTPKPEKQKKTEQKKKEKTSLFEKLKRFLGKIKYTFQKICDNIKSLVKKKDRLTAFVEDEVHRKAFFRAVKEIRRLLGTLRPKDADIRLKFGFSDPALTGYALALISMFWPFVGEHTQIEPDFENKVFRGKACVKGRIRAVHAVILAWNLLLDKNVRTTYTHIRNFKF